MIMSRDPTYPEDAPVEPPAGAAILSESARSNARRTKHIVAGAAIGIGSAALVAALLYANRARKADKA